MKPCTPARSVREFKELMQTDPEEVYFIRSAEDWERFRRNADSQENPLEPLTEEEVEEFTRSLVFRNGGLAGAKVDVIETRLSYRQYRNLMGAFGMDIVLERDYRGWYCSARGTCRQETLAICTSNC